MVDNSEKDNVGAAFAQALAIKDWTSVRSLLADDLDFRGMTPNQIWEASADELETKVLRQWFEDDEIMDGLVECDSRTVGNVECVRYLIRVIYVEGPHLVEQQAYFRTENGRINWLRIMCSGSMPIDESQETA
jgi:hypothetical protein